MGGRIASDAQPRTPHGEREDPDIPARHRQVRVPVRLCRQARAATRSHV